MLLFVLAISFSACGEKTETSERQNSSAQEKVQTTENTAEHEHGLPLSENIIRISQGDHIATFQLYDMTAAEELYSQLLLTLEVTNFRNAQWMFYPPERLIVTEKEIYRDGKKGELSYYEPWGDVFMLYEDFQSGDDMHRIGICLEGIDELKEMSETILVEKADPADELNHAQNNTESDSGEHMVKMTVGTNELTVRLYDTPAANDLYSMLPLELTFSDFNGTEKISYLPRNLDTNGEPNSFDPDVGDLTLYKPWGNLAIFYRDFRSSTGLISLGHIDSGMDVLSSMDGEISVILEKVN